MLAGRLVTLRKRYKDPVSNQRVGEVMVVGQS